MTDPRPQFELEQSQQTGMPALQVKFERAFTGGYRDSVINRAFREYMASLVMREAA